MTSDVLSLALALCAGIALAAACGLRAFLPLLALGLAARAGIVPLAETARWMQSDLALLALGVATVLEIAGDKIPAVDHALDVVGTVLRPMAAAVAAYGLLSAWPTPWPQIAAVAFGGTAFVLHAVKAKTRLASTIASFGAANPVLSVIEDAIAAVLAFLAVLVPLLAAGLLVLVTVLVVNRMRRRAVRRAVAS